MFNTSNIIQLATDAFRSVAIKHEFHLNMCRAIIKMLEQGRLVLSLKVAPYFVVKSDKEANIRPSPLPRPQLPPSLRYMPEHKKARLRATYSRAKQIYRPNAAHLSRDQRTEEPVKLSGSNAATNIALWPSAMQVNLGHDYKAGDSSTAPSPGEVPICVESRADETIQGAIAVLDALVRGVDEAWLEAPGVGKRLESATLPAIAQGEQGVSSPATPAPRMTRSNEQLGSPVLVRGIRSQGTHCATTCTTRSFGHYELPAGDTDTHVSPPGTRRMACSDIQRGSLSPARGNRTLKPLAIARSHVQLTHCDPPQPIRSYKETYETTPHNKDRLRATFERAQNIYRPGSCVRPVGQRAGSDSKLALHGTDGALNVALYPRATLVRLNPDEEAKLKALESTVRDAPGTIEGTIARLEAIVGGVGYEWLGMDQPELLQKTPAALRLQSPSSSLPSSLPMSSGSSVTSVSTTSSISEVATPLDQTFPLGLGGKDRRL